MPGAKLATVSHFGAQRSIGPQEETEHQREGTKQRPQARKLLERTGVVCGMIKGTGGDTTLWQTVWAAASAGEEPAAEASALCPQKAPDLSGV